MTKLAHYRIAGYVVTLAMHIGNTIAVNVFLRGKVLEDPDVKTMKSMEFCYYTVWNIVFQLMYASLGLYCDVRSLNSRSQDSKLSKYIEYRSYFFGAVLWPSTLFIFTIFWPIFLYDRSLIFPEFIDRAISQYPNYVMHGTILPLMVWEMVFLPRNIPKLHKTNLIWINVIFVTYFSWIIYVNTTRGLWPYPFLYLIEGTVYFPLFLLMVYLLLHIHYFTQWIFVNCIWGNKHDMKSS